MWQTDFKGEFRMADSNYCYPLDIIDDYSRFVIKIAPHLGAANVVIPAFTEAFREFGLLDSILSYNGKQFTDFKKGYTQFDRWLMDLNILLVHGRIKHPQTQGKIERFHRTKKQEPLNHIDIANIEDARCKFAIWRDKYNNIHPHSALGIKRPEGVYEPCKRQYCESIEKYEYSGAHHVIKVNNRGCVWFDKWQVYLSETMIG